MYDATNYNIQYRILEGYGLGKARRADKARLVVLLAETALGNVKLRRARQSSCSLCARGGTNGMLFTNAKTNTPINYKTILLLQAPGAPIKPCKMTFVVATPLRSLSVISVLNFWGSPASPCNPDETRNRLFLFPSLRPLLSSSSYQTP